MLTWPARYQRQYLGAGLVVLLILFLSLHQSPTLRDHALKQIPLTQNSRWGTTFSRSSPVWATTEEGLTQFHLTEPHENVRVTLISAVVRHNNETYRRKGINYNQFVSIPIHLMSLPYKNENHQILSTRIEDLVRSISCIHTYNQRRYFTLATFRHLDWVSVINCPISYPLEAEIKKMKANLLETELNWEFKDEKGKFSHSVQLEPKYPKAEAEFGICLSPIWSHLDARALVEWRLNALRLGIRSVHWHSRDAAVGHFVEQLSRASGAADTFMYAPPTSLETYGVRDNLADNGLYGDQIIYYISCQYRSMFTQPTRWLGYIDRDEDFFPKEIPSASDSRAKIQTDLKSMQKLVPDYLANLPESIGSVCFGKSYHGGLLDLTDLVDPAVAKTPAPELAYFSFFTPATESVKCVHRMKAYEMASVHYGERWFPGYHQILLTNQTEASVPFHFMHQTGHSPAGGEDPNRPIPYEAQDLEMYLAGLWEQRENVLNKMNWACREVPCRFASI